MKIKYILLIAVTFLVHTVDAQIKQTINEFSVLEVTDRLWVSIVPSDRHEIEIKGDLADKVEAVYSQGQLRLKMKGGYIMQGDQANVVVYTPSVSKIIAKKGSEVNVEESAIEEEAMSFTASEGAKIRALINAVGVDATVNTGASIDLLGSATKLNVRTTAGANFYGKDLKTDIVHVRVNAGGKTEVYATESADVETRAGGTIDVYGNPTNKRDKKIAGGRITFHK
ncbi:MULTISPECIES: GIN domain-containing protein [Sphingobacterium]|jgi:hypothetical protein|uniref:GIN domain-containing protein n=1 Tax=Sphingobacterium TaxID=28453 RepID=UPI000C0BD35A|nr:MULTISPECIES: DUF2807 domain-containing protein [Sphingobacterium]MCT1529887.1 DUF2807 domain-containing protein [Sphingobacterium daejeonense]